MSLPNTPARVLWTHSSFLSTTSYPNYLPSHPNIPSMPLTGLPNKTSPFLIFALPRRKIPIGKWHSSPHPTLCWLEARRQKRQSNTRIPVSIRSICVLLWLCYAHEYSEGSTASSMTRLMALRRPFTGFPEAPRRFRKTGKRASM